MGDTTSRFQTELKGALSVFLESRFWVIWIACQAAGGALFYLPGILPLSQTVVVALSVALTAVGMVAHLLAQPPAGTIWQSIRSRLDAFWIDNLGALNSRLVKTVGAGGVIVLTSLGAYTSGYIGHWESGGKVYHYAYRDAANPNLWSVCDGITGPDVIPHRYYSTAACDNLRNKHMLIAEKRLQAEVPTWSEIPNLSYAAFVDWTYNLGGEPNSTAVRFLREGNYKAACLQIPRWIYANGLVLKGILKRRIYGDGQYPSERDLCLKGLSQ